MPITMQRIFAYLVLALCANNAIATDNPVISINKYDRTDSSIVVQGVAKIIPPGTKMWVTVVRFNGKPMVDKLAIDDTAAFTASDGTFFATLKKDGSVNRFDFPDGKYELEFYAHFNRSWQTIEVARRAGVELDVQGRSGVSSEPHSLPKSSDLVAGDSFGEKFRVLRARRMIEIKSANSSFKVDVKIMRDPRADVNLKGARAWLMAANMEIKKARVLISNSQTDEVIGAQSRRILSIRDQGLSIFPTNPNWFECRAVAVNIWPLWWYGFRGKHEGHANAKQDEAEFGQLFQESVAKCRLFLG